MVGQRKRTASACLGSARTGRPVRKSARLALVQRQKENTHGVPDKFPWASLPTDLQERIMSNLTVHETAVFTCAVLSRDARDIHRGMMQRRHEALRDILRKQFGKKAARLMPPLDMADPGDVCVNSQVPPLLQLRPHQTPYKKGTFTVVERMLGEYALNFAGRCQGYFTRAGLEGWGRWDGTAWDGSRRSFVGEWRAGQQHWGKWVSVGGAVWTGAFRNNRQHGPTLFEDPRGFVFDYEFDNGRVVTRKLRGLQP